VNGVSGIGAGDTNNDGVAEVVWGGGLISSGRDALFVGDWQSESIEWSSVDLDAPLHVTAGDVDGHGQTEIVMASTSTDGTFNYNGSLGGGHLRVYDGATHRQEWSMTFDPSSNFIHQVEVAQLDADPALEIVAGLDVRRFARLRVFDGQTHAVEWESGNLAPTATNVAFWLHVANVDADVTDELIVGLGTGEVRVIDGASKNVQWTSPQLDAAIGDLSIGNLDGGSDLELVAATTKSVYVFEVGTWRQLSRKDLRINGKPTGPRVAIVDATEKRSGNLVVVTSTVEQPHLLRVWSGRDWRLRSQQVLAYGVTYDLLSHDLDVDGDEELVVMGNYPGTQTVAAPTQLLIGSWLDNQYQFEYHHGGRWGSIKKGVVADVDNDARQDFVFSSTTMVQVNAIAAVTEDTASAVRFDGWTGHGHTPGSTFRSASTASQTIRYQTAVASDAISLITARGPNQGMAQVFINGVDLGTLDLYTPTTQHYVKTFSNLPLKTHTIVVKVLGRKNPMSTATTVRVDGFMVGTTIVDELRPEVTFGAWTGRIDSRASGGTYRTTSTAGASVVFRFTGTAFSWVTARGPGFGQAEVIVDGRRRAIVDLYSKAQQWQHAEAFSNLVSGQHIVTIRALGTRNSGSNGRAIVFDGFLVP
jgi:hypothetical protein